MYDRKGDTRSGLSDLDQAVRVAPKSAHSRALRGCLRVKSGDYEGGLTDLRAAISLDPTDPAGKFEAWPKPPLTEDAVRFGERQVAQMLRDRPTMAKYGKDAEPLCRWAARKFAGEDLKQTIRWDPKEPLAPQAENYVPVAPGDAPRILIRETCCEGEKKGKKRTAEDLWCSAVYELYNISAADDFRRLDAEAVAGRVKKEAYVARTVEIESRAIDKTRAFYINVFLPWAKEHRVPTDPWVWYIGTRGDPGENTASLQLDREATHVTAYEHKYDFTVLQSLVMKCDYKNARTLASKMLADSLVKVEEEGIHVLRGMAYLGDGDADSAIADLNEAIRLEPNDALAHDNRGRAFCMRRDYDKAIADEDAALRLGVDGDVLTKAEAFRLRGCSYGHKGEYDKAIADINEAIRLYPKSAESYNYRSWVYRQKGDIDKAESDAKRARELDGKPSP